MAADDVLLGIAAIPFIYYLIVLYSSWRYFHEPASSLADSFTPPVSILKPIRGLDPDAYENLASFCRLDYPVFEIVFCVDADDEEVLSVLEKLQLHFPERRIRVLHGSGRIAPNDKCAKLARLVSEAEHEVVVISDSDVRVRPDYVRQVTAPLRDPQVGAATCFYVPAEIKTFTDRIQTVGMMSDFYAGILVAAQLDGVKFTLGPTIATTRSRLAAFGGYAALENRPGDDLLVGRLIAEQGYRVALLRYTIETVSDYRSMRELLYKRLRWMVVMRHMRPWGHYGLLWTQGLPWSIAAVAIHPSAAAAFFYLSAYFGLRLAITWVISTRGLHQTRLWKLAPLIPAWDAFAFAIWAASFFRNSIRWRGADYYIRDGQLVPASRNRAKPGLVARGSESDPAP